MNVARNRALAVYLKGGMAIAVAVVFLLPFLVMVSTSLKADTELITNRSLLPGDLQWTNYSRAVTYIPFARFLANTLVLCAFSIIGTLLSCTLIAYGFSRIEWPGRGFWFAIMMGTLMLPAQVTMIPVFVIFKKLGLVGTYVPLILPAFLGNALYVFLIRQFMLGIPREMNEAARIDGCTEMHTCLKIFVPLIKPVLILVGLMVFVTTWNDFLTPLIYLNDYSKFTLALGLQQFFGQHGAEFSLLMAACTLMMIPVIVLFLFSQKHFVESVATSGLGN